LLRGWRWWGDGGMLHFSRSEEGLLLNLTQYVWSYYSLTLFIFVGQKTCVMHIIQLCCLIFFASLPIAFFIFPFHLQSLCFLTYFFRGQQIYLAAKLNLLLSPFVCKSSLQLLPYLCPRFEHLFFLQHLVSSSFSFALMALT